MLATLFTDPGCPWGYSANPDLTVLRWRYGQALRWKVVLIGLAETGERYVKAGYTPERMVAGYPGYRRRFGMPFAVEPAEPRERVTGTGRACRAVVAARLQDPELEWAALRALQFAWFTTNALLDDDAQIAAALEPVEGLDVPALIASLGGQAVEDAYQIDRAHSRTAAGGATEYQGKSANTDGAERFTAPSVVFTTGTGRTLEAGGFQSLAVYDACIANLDRTLPRRGPAGSALEVVQAFSEGVTTFEVAAVLAEPLTEPDRAGAQAQLEALAADGAVRRTPLGDDALWKRLAA